MFRQMDAFGYGSRAFAAKWLMENGHQKGNPDTQKDVNRVAKKVSHILKGYVRGIHPTMHNGGVWSAEEAEHIVTLLETWLQENPDIDLHPPDDFTSLRKPRAPKEPVVVEDDAF